LEIECDPNDTAHFDTRNAEMNFEESDEFINVNRGTKQANGSIHDLEY